MEKKSQKKTPSNAVRCNNTNTGGAGAATVSASASPVTAVTVTPSATLQQHHHHSSITKAGIAGGTTGTAGTASTKHRSSGSSHHHHSSHHHTTTSHHQSQSLLANNKNNISSIRALINGKARMEAGTVVATGDNKLTPIAATTTTTIVSSKTVTTAAAAILRNKNEEAISDLRQRIPEIENIFDVHSRIGNGTFSTVLLGTLKKENKLPENMRRKFAIKHHIPTSHPDRIMKELQCMAKIGGTDNVVGINCCIRYNESVAFIMPYLQHDRFHDFFSKMEISEVQHYMRNLLIALRHVHKFNVIHRDVKPSNFLYNRRKRQFLLVDFGLAQQIPAIQLSSSVESTGSMYAALPTALGTEGKRAREHDEAGSSKTNDVAAVVGGDNVSAKRLRCTGPQGDQQHISAAETPHARVASSYIVGGSPFKMPLKQLNEISAPAKTATAGSGGTGGGLIGGGNAGSGGAANANANNAANSNSIYEAPLSRQVKSAILGATIGSPLQQKLRSGTGRSGNSNTAAGGGGGGGGCNVTSGSSSSSQIPPASSTLANNASATAADNTKIPSANSKYNTNKNLSITRGSKCYCYGNPQVCNICLIRKEIHASRAGTPGYRPPEVLLKYPDQTTSVDIWAAGVIFLSILSSVYPFFKAPNDFVALAEMVTIFGDKTIRKTAFILDRLVTLSQKTKPLDLRKLCVRFRNRIKFSSPELLKKYQRSDGSCEVCKNCDQFYFNCLCTETNYSTEPLEADDPFPASAYDLLYKLLEVNPHKRITAAEALNHPFFSEKAFLTNNTPSTPAADTTTTPSNNNNNISAVDKMGRD